MRTHPPAAALRLAASALCVLLLLMTLPTGSAHPVQTYCGGPGDLGAQVWPGAYLQQFDPEDPNTWTSSVGAVNGVGDCSRGQRMRCLEEIRTSPHIEVHPWIAHHLGPCDWLPEGWDNPGGPSVGGGVGDP